MEIPTKLRPVLVVFRYWFLALILLASSMILISCGDSDKTITTGASEPKTGETPGSIDFVSAIPETIVLSGTGGVESAEVVFTVFNLTNQPLSGQTVNFSLSTSVGGLSLFNTSGVSNEEGEVRTFVNSGNVPTSVRVTATVEGTDISTVSDSLVISIGLPDQDSFSLSVDIFNPEAWQYDGETISLNIRAADHYNNPVPDGTAIYFTTEGGSIDPQCNTTGGGCSVTWESQNPRPSGSFSDNAGLSTILATALGEEVFLDVNGDGQFSLVDKAQWDKNPDLDLPEAFRDDNLNGDYDVGEAFFDFNIDALYSPANGLFNGTLCTDDGIIDGVCTRDLVHVRETIVISMSGSFAEMDIFDENLNPIEVICLRDLRPGQDGYFDGNGDGCNDVVTPGDPNCDDVGNFLVRVADVNDNSMPLNTTVTATSSLGEMLGTSSYTIDNTIFPSFLLFSIQEVCGGVPEAQIEVKALTPKGNETIRTFTVLDDG